LEEGYPLRPTDRKGTEKRLLGAFRVEWLIVAEGCKKCETAVFINKDFLPRILKQGRRSRWMAVKKANPRMPRSKLP
jgi:hypothetical protein